MERKRKTEISRAQMSGEPRTICLVTEELAGAGRSGGIGAAFKEMALLLSNSGFQVDILFHDAANIGESIFEEAKLYYQTHNIRLSKVNIEKFVDGPPTPRATSYAIYQTLSQIKRGYDFIHFHDYKGLGFFCGEAKRQGIAFAETVLVVQLHGPTRWAIEANSAFFTHEDQLMIDFMERKSIEWADERVSPSAYLAKWVNENFFPENNLDIKVIKNLCRNIVAEVRRAGDSASEKSNETRLSEIIIFGRHEERKGISFACDALDLLSDFLEENRISVTFLGQPGQIREQPSAVYFVERAKKWAFDFRFHFGLGRSEVAKYLANAQNSLVLVPSPHENSPYTVLETLILGRSILCSTQGGGIELIHEDDRAKACCEISGPKIADAVKAIQKGGLHYSRCAESTEDVERAWLAFHRNRRAGALAEKRRKTEPFITVGITHFERPVKVVDAVISLLRQTYQNFEIIVVDDGSTSPETLKSLEYLEKVLGRSKGRLVRQANGYLGAARNTVLREARGEYVLFLDDDDLAMPQMIETLVAGAVNSGCDVLTCFNIFMPEDLRSEVLGGTYQDRRVSYFPLGGPLALSPEQNVYGSATALLRREILLEIGGYTEIKNVGHEDYELYIRLNQSGAKMGVCPEPLFFYEVGRPSMISSTSLMRNFKRCYGAIDFHDNTGDWADYINLAVGRTIAVNSHNRTWWLNSQAKTADMRHRLMQGEDSLEDYLEIARAIAEAEGNPRLAMAFSRGLAFRDAYREAETEAEQHRFVPVLPFQVPKADVTPLRSDPALSEVRAELALGNLTSAMNLLVSYCKEKEELPLDINVVLSELLQCDLRRVDRNATKELLASLAHCKIRGEDKGILVSLLPLVVTVEDREMLVKILEYLVGEEEAEYEEKYKDVADVTRQGGMRPFHHFLLHGKNEGRLGFTKCREAVEAIGKIRGKDAQLEDLPRILNSLKDRDGIPVQSNVARVQ